MANSSRNAANSKKKTTTKSNGKKPVGKKSKAKPQAVENYKSAASVEMNRVACIVLFALSVLAFFVAVIKGDGAWHFVHNVYLGIFGYFGAIIFPVITIILNIISAVKQPQTSVFIVKTVESVFMVVLLCSFIHIVTFDGGVYYGEALKDAYYSAPETFNGGWTGALTGGLLLTCGKAPAIIISLVLIFIDFMLLSGITLIEFFKGIGKPAVKTKEKITPVIEEKVAERRRKKFNIDVELDENPPQTDEEKPVKKANKKVVGDINDNGISQDLIDEINNSADKHRKERLSKENSKQKTAEKSIDDIVSAAAVVGKITEEEKLKVPKEAMSKTVEDYVFPSVDLLSTAKPADTKDISGELKDNAEKLIDALHSFNVDAKITDISRGPTVTRYELKPAPGIRISKITNLTDDIALNLAAASIRIEAPIPGKAAVGIEVPNKVKNIVTMRELIDTYEFDKQKSKLTAGLGKDIAGNCIYADMAKMPHLLIAGTTGSGKSVCMNSIIVSMLYKASPDEVKFLMIDPKKVEFSKYSGIPHLLVPVVTDARKAAGALGWAVSEMLQRYQKFSDTGVRDIGGYNKYVKNHPEMEPMPKIVIFIDELADLMMAAPKEVEDSICRLAQMARAAGMHLIIATQRPSVDVITGLIKANISSRIALAVSSQIDSRTILDSAGAEKLLGHGDMLFNPVGASKPLRVQGCYISDEEVESLCDFIKNQGESEYSDEIQKEIEKNAVAEKKSSPFIDDVDPSEKLDDLFEKAVDLVLENGTASTSFLQRKLGVGYARGAKIIDQLEDKGIIGQSEGSKGRKILINRQQWLEMQAYSTNAVSEQVTIEENNEFGETSVEE